MTAHETDATAVECLAAAGLSAGDVRDWLQAEPGETTDFPADRKKFSGYWEKSSRLLARLPVLLWLFGAVLDHGRLILDSAVDLDAPRLRTDPAFGALRSRLLAALGINEIAEGNH